MPPPCVAVIGGTGFIGAHIVAALRARGVEARVCSRATGVDVATGAGVAAAVQGAHAVVNAVALYHPTRRRGLRAVHVDGAARVAATAATVGARVVHVSGLNAPP
eukprot:gene10790-64717_t